MATLQPNYCAENKFKRWDFISRFNGEIILGNGNSLKINAYMTEYGSLFLGVDRKGWFLFKPRFVYSRFVSKVLRLDSMDDAANLADWINSQLRKFKKEQGTYIDQSI
jgi:hypothetical protein